MLKKWMNKYEKCSLQSDSDIQHIWKKETYTFFLPLIEAQKVLQWPSAPEAVNQLFVLTACHPNSDFVWEK